MEPATLVSIDANRQAARPGKGRRTPTLPHFPLFLLFLLAALPPPLQAQEDGRYRRLIFEPVALERLPGEADTLREIGAPPVAAATAAPSSPQPAGAQPEPEEDAGDRAIAGYEGAIRALELEGGPYEAGLVQELLALGTALQEREEHARALDVFERAWHVNRVNQGLFNLDQAPIIGRMIDSYIALGDLLAADEQQEYLYYIQQKAHGSESPEILPALISLADWNIAAYNLRLRPRVGGSYAGETEYPAPPDPEFDLQDFRSRRLINAQNLYRAVIEIILEHHGVDDPRLLAAEQKLVLANYFFATNFSVSSNAFQNASNGFIMPSTQPPGLDLRYVSSNSMGYRHGRDALERRIDYLRRRDSTEPAVLARALVDLGDWMLVFKKRVSGIEAYQEASRTLAEADPAALQALLDPAVPITLPTFVDDSYSRAIHRIAEDQPLRYRGHIDVAFRLNQYGLPGSIEVLGRAGDLDAELEGRLLRHLRESQFRPRFDGLEPRDGDPVLLRYYVSWQSP